MHIIGGMFELERISEEAIPAALEKAERYRLLNEPLQAESICLDVLEINPENQTALVTLILATSDQFTGANPAKLRTARTLVPRLESEYDQAYYAGILAERRATSLVEQGGGQRCQVAYELYRDGRRCCYRSRAGPDSGFSIRRAGERVGDAICR